MEIPWEVIQIQRKEVINVKGIYKFTNKINGKVYIGQSVNLKNRYLAHKNSYNNSNCSGYNTLFYQALRKYGWENFDYEILIEDDNLTVDELNELEKQYIKQYDSFRNNGYNLTIGGKDIHNLEQKALTKEDVLKIKNLLINSNLNFKQISELFPQLSKDSNTISMINQGQTWFDVGPNNYPLRSKDDINKNAFRGSNNASAKLNENDVMTIRQLYITLTINEIYEQYKDKISYSEIRKIIYGSTFSHLPIYKKREKKWYLNKTCIDYPRIEE